MGSIDIERAWRKGNTAVKQSKITLMDGAMEALAFIDGCFKNRPRHIVLAHARSSKIVKKNCKKEVQRHIVLVGCTSSCRALPAWSISVRSTQFLWNPLPSEVDGLNIGRADQIN